MNPRTAVALLLIGGGALLLGGRSGGQVEAGDDDDGGFLTNWNLDALMDNLSTYTNRALDAASSVVDDVPVDQAATNCAAWIATIGQAEGADYSTCYGYSMTISDFSDHPANLGWPGVKLSDAMCKNAGFGPGCVSTAAGKGQITKGTWNRVAAKLGLPDFSQASQDQAILQLTAERGALEAVKAGDVATAANRCRNEWASLPGNYAGQGQRSVDQLASWFAAAGGQAATA
jgi:muramidase (phage lysozyme)